MSIAGVDVVTTDEDDAAQRVVAHLYDHGHRQIAHITGGNNRPSRDREKALRKTMTEFGLDVRVVPGTFTEDGGRRGVLQLMAEDHVPTAVVGANDLSAVGAIGALRSAGLRVPDDVSVIGYDDSQIARLEVVQLTSVCQSIEQFGQTAIATLLERIEDPRRERSVQRLRTELVERSTSGPAPVTSRAAVRRRRRSG